MVRECLRRVVVFVFLVAVGASPSAALAESEFAAGERFIEEVVVEGIPISTAIAFAPDSRIFVALKDGVVRVAQMLREGMLKLLKGQHQATCQGEAT